MKLLPIANCQFSLKAVTRYMTTLLFGVKPIDAVTFVGVGLALAVVVFVACLVPARRAAKIDPLEALR